MEAEQFLREGEQLLRKAEQFFREAEQFLREWEQLPREVEQFLREPEQFPQFLREGKQVAKNTAFNCCYGQCCAFLHEKIRGDKKFDGVLLFLSPTLLLSRRHIGTQDSLSIRS
jgi:hypothetical protein